jgi:S1-C subfamily serine protease
VRVKKPGFQEWVRNVNLYGGSVTLNAELAPGTDEVHKATTEMADSSTESVTAVALTNSSSQKSIGWIGFHAQNKGDVAVVTSVAADGPAAKAGVQVGDIILALDGRLIKGKDFETTVATLKPGTQISVNYARGSAAHEVWMTVGSQK